MKLKVIVAAVTILGEVEDVDDNNGTFTLSIPSFVECGSCGGPITLKTGRKMVIDNVEKEVKFYHVDCANRSI